MPDRIRLCSRFFQNFMKKWKPSGLEKRIAPGQKNYLQEKLLKFQFYLIDEKYSRLKYRIKKV